jgi:hypothetical protein
MAPRPHTLWLYWQPPFAAKVQKLLMGSASHEAKAPNWFGEMQTITEYKTFILRITLGLSEAAVQSLSVSLRRARRMTTPKCA